MSGRRLASLSSSMLTRRRSCNCHSYVLPCNCMTLPADINDCIQFKTRLSKQEARSFHRPALQFPSNIELHFAKVRTAKKKKDKAGRKVGKGGNVGEGLHRTGDLSLRDTSNFVLWEFSVRAQNHTAVSASLDNLLGGASANHFELWYGQYSGKLLQEEEREGRAYTKGWRPEPYLTKRPNALSHSMTSASPLSSSLKMSLRS